MTRVNGLLLGAFITSCILSFGLWINSQVGLSVEMVDSVPARMLSTNDADIAIERQKKLNAHSLITRGEAGSNASYMWSRTPEERFISVGNLVTNELGEYSQNYLEGIGVNEIIIVSDITTHIGGPVLGFADPLRGQVYLNAVKVVGEQSRAVVAEQTLHHELAHLLAYELYGYGFDRNSQWAKEDSFDYGRHHQANGQYFPRDGFVSSYSMTSASEDFAEVYSLIYTNYFQELLFEEAEKSQLLSQKLSFVYDSIGKISPDQCRISPAIIDIACK